VRLDIRYLTRFSYSQAVRESQNELRACPATDHRQQLLSYRVQTAPAARVLSYTDYWGTRVDAFGVRLPHQSLEVLAEASVETRPSPLLTATALMSRLSDRAFKDEHADYLAPSEHTDWGEMVAQEAAQRAGVADDVVGVVLALHRWIGAAFSYVPGATYVGVDVDDVFRRRVGVCQDYAHLSVAMCRSLGIPARYVSGYLFAADETASDGADMPEVVEVQTHAWIEVAIPDVGWWGLDPTNRQEVGPRHVKIGHGRDYGDVPPVRGVFLGPSDHRLEVTVTIRRHSHPLEMLHPVPFATAATTFVQLSQQQQQQQQQ
jgi:transglutaminase-like putative cysteine protease